MDRAPGMRSRLKLTLSYAGFLMLAGVLMLAAVWVVVLRYIPDGALSHMHPSWWFVIDRSDPLHGFGSVAAIVLAFLLVFGLAGGWILAGRMLAPLARITDATRMAATGSLSHRIELPGRQDEFRELADAFDAMLARLEAHSAEQRRFAANASHELRTPLSITQTLLEVARNDPSCDPGELVNRLQVVNTRAIEVTKALLLLSRADQRSFTSEPVDLSLIAEEATETLLPLAEKRGVTIETSGGHALAVGSEALLLQLTTNLVHNAIVHNMPRHGTVSVATSTRSTTAVARCREPRRAAHPPVGFHPCRTVSARDRTHTQRPRRRRPRPRNRQKHHPSTRRNPQGHPARRRRAQRHGASTCRATAQRKVSARPSPTTRHIQVGHASEVPRRGACCRKHSGVAVEARRSAAGDEGNHNGSRRPVAPLRGRRQRVQESLGVVELDSGRLQLAAGLFPG